jgi:hypothetical protein
MARVDLRPEKPRRARFWLLGSMALLAFGIGLARELREPRPESPEPSRPAARAAGLPPAPAASEAGAARLAPRDAPASASARDEIRAALEASLAESLPDRKLSSDQLDAATDALLRLSEAQRSLRILPRTRQNAERLAELREAIGQASADFEYVIDLDPARFLQAVSPGVDR